MRWTRRSTLRALTATAAVSGLPRVACAGIPPAAAAGTVRIGGEFPVRRLGLGTGEIAGVARSGSADERRAARQLLRRAVELGIDFLDTADIYGDGAAEQLIYEALYPYPRQLLIASKGGQAHAPQPGPSVPSGRPEHLVAACEGSLKRLHLERIGLYFLHAPDPQVPLEDSLGALVRLREQGKIAHLGISNVDAAQLAKARRITPIAAVQNPFGAYMAAQDETLAMCERARIVYSCYAPLGTRARPADPGRVAALQRLADRHHIDQNQARLAWLLSRSPLILPIFGTTRIEHLEDNVRAAGVRFAHDELRAGGI